MNVPNTDKVKLCDMGITEAKEIMWRIMTAPHTVESYVEGTDVWSDWVDSDFICVNFIYRTKQ